MTDPLAGMTVKEARAIVAELRMACEAFEGVDMLTSDFKKAYALAALGAECVGAKRGHVCGAFDADEAEPAGIWVEVASCTLDEMPSGTSVLVLKEDRC